MSSSRNLKLPFLAEAQAQKHVTVNEALRRVDAVVQLSVIERTRKTPPGAPTEGDRYIIAANPNGGWAGRPFQVAAYIDGAWTYFEPAPGWMAFVEDEDALVYFDGSAWQTLTAVSGGAGTGTTAPRFGVNTSADSNNLFKVRSAASLFEADRAGAGGDVRLALSKEAEDDTASHIFQSNYSGRAEFGLLGDDDFSLKVSADGSSFATAFSVDSDSAVVDFAKTPTVGGAQAFLPSVASLAEVASRTFPASVSRIETRGYAAENDGGGGVYERVGAPADDGLGTTDAGGRHWSLAGDTVTARQAGAVGNASADDTDALNRALASGRTVLLEHGTYRITDKIATGAQAQQVLGAGRFNTRIVVNVADFNMAAEGAIKVKDHRATVADLSIIMYQDGADTRETLAAYPPAISLSPGADNADAATRVRLARIRIERGYDGIDARGNTGGAIFDDIECGTFNEGFIFDGALDTVEMRNCRVWLYGFSPPGDLNDIFQDGTTIAFNIGKVDDLKMVDCTAFSSRVILGNGTEGPFGNIIGLTLDGNASRIEMNAGEVQIASVYGAIPHSGQFLVEQTGGDLSISGFDFDVTTEADQPVVHVNGPNAVCSVSNGNMEFQASRLADGFLVDQGRLSVSNVDFDVAASVGTRIGACIRQRGLNSVLTALGNRCTAANASSGPFIDVAERGAHTVVGNHANGWQINLAGFRDLALYGPNYRSRGPEFDVPDTGLKVNGNTGDTASLLGHTLSFSHGLSLSRGNADDNHSLALGRNALDSITGGAGNTMLGSGAGDALDNGNNNTGLGRNTFKGGATTVSNSTAVGFGAFVTGSNQVQLGNSATTTYVHNTVQSRSDARDKTDVRETTLGLSFVRALRPVDYRWDYREDYAPPAEHEPGWTAPAPGSRARTRFHHGFLAHEVAAAAETLGADFGGYQDHTVTGGADVKTLGYTEMIAPLVRAVQELAARLEALEPVSNDG